MWSKKYFFCGIKSYLLLFRKKKSPLWKKKHCLCETKSYFLTLWKKKHFLCGTKSHFCGIKSTFDEKKLKIVEQKVTLKKKVFFFPHDVE